MPRWCHWTWTFVLVVSLGSWLGCASVGSPNSPGSFPPRDSYYPHGEEVTQVSAEAAFESCTTSCSPQTVLGRVTLVSNQVSDPANPSTRPSVELNLPSALALVQPSHPVVGLAQWRTREAYANLTAAKALWLPSIRAGLSTHRHDGNYQASDGEIIDVNRNSLQYGLGMGATGAGTTPLPGIVAQFHLADAIFRPDIAQKTAWARGHDTTAATNRQLRDVAVAYTHLVGAAQEAAILTSSRDTFADIQRLVTDFSEAGEGLQSDADRMAVETMLTENRLLQAQQNVDTASARLQQAVSLDQPMLIVPMDVVAVPVTLTATTEEIGTLVQTGLSIRPELKASQALVAAACEAYQREKYAPMVPSVLLGFSTGGFGGGLANDLDQVNNRYDFDAVVSWELRQFGVGEKAARAAASARVQQAKYTKVQQMDQVARQVSEAAAEVRGTTQQLQWTRQAIKIAERSYESNRDRINDGEGLPIEVLQSIQALETARLAYLRAVIDHNVAQFQLQWAMGFPIS